MGTPHSHQAGAWLLAIFRKLTATWHKQVFQQSPSDGTRAGAAQIHVGFDRPDTRQVSSRDVVGTQMHLPPTFRARNESLNCRRGLISGFGLRRRQKHGLQRGISAQESLDPTTRPCWAAGASTLHAMLLDPSHGPIDELPLPKESRRRLPDKGGCQLMCGFIGGPKRRKIVGLQQR